MKFETAKNLVKGFLIAGIVCCVAAMLTNTNGSIASYYLGMGAIGCIIMCLFFVVAGLKCPWCGKRIIRRCLVLKVCPYCHRDLTTGEKKKGKKSK